MVEHLGTVGVPKGDRELVLTVVLLSVPRLPAPGKEGGLRSLLPNPLGSSGAALSRWAHGQSLALAILGQSALAWQVGCRDLRLTAATGSGAAGSAEFALLPRASKGTKNWAQGKTELWHCRAGSAGPGMG